MGKGGGGEPTNTKDWGRGGYKRRCNIRTLKNVAMLKCTSAMISERCHFS
jgi:hypothetical protein